MDRLNDVWRELGHPRLLVVGDLMLDRYTWGETQRISPEAPVLILRETDDDVRLGGAANVAALLRHLEADVVLAGIVGDDAAGRIVQRLLDDMGIDREAVLSVADRPTTEKHRFVGRTGTRTSHQLLRVDREVCIPLETALESQYLAKILAVLPACDGVILSDYAKGMLTPTVIQTVTQATRRYGIPLLVDPSRGSSPSRYAGARLVAPNRAAAELWVGEPLRSRETILAAVQRLRQQASADAAVITLDRDGLAFADGDECDLLPSRPREVCDVTGAGDMVQAVLGLGLAEGLSVRESLTLANLAAGLEVERFGVVPISRGEIALELLNDHSPPKLQTLPGLLTTLASARRAGRTIVFTNGCFDLLHVGHIALLEEAAQAGDVLVVAINSDASVRRLKGPNRPVIRQEQRARLLAALACVDYVLVFEEETPHVLLNAIRPDVLVKGGTTPLIVGRDVVEAYGGRVLQTVCIPGESTTAITQRFRSEPVAL